MSRRIPQRLLGTFPMRSLRRFHRMRAALSSSIVLCTFALTAEMTSAGELIAHVTDAKGAPVPNAVIALYGTQKADIKPTDKATKKPPADAAMDQRGLQFAPHVLVVQRGAAVTFPNRDDIRHQVYSFSPAKRFNLPLYHGVPAKPETFSQAGEVVLGCNIHDNMLGYVYVVDTEWFAKTDAEGNLKIGDVPAGSYRAQLWYPGLAASSAAIEKTINIPAAGSAQIGFNDAVAEATPQPAPTETRSWGARRGARQSP